MREGQDGNVTLGEMRWRVSLRWCASLQHGSGGGGGRQSPEASPGRWEMAALQVLLSLQGVGISCLNLHIYFWFRSFASVRRGVQLSRFPERL